MSGRQIVPRIWLYHFWRYKTHLVIDGIFADNYYILLNLTNKSPILHIITITLNTYITRHSKTIAYSLTAQRQLIYFFCVPIAVSRRWLWQLNCEWALRALNLVINLSERRPWAPVGNGLRLGGSLKAKWTWPRLGLWLSRAAGADFDGEAGTGDIYVLWPRGPCMLFLEWSKYNRQSCPVNVGDVKSRLLLMGYS